MFFKLQIAALVILISTFTLAQQASPKSAPARSASQPAAKAMPTQGPANPAAKRKAFVLDVVRMAVAMPQPDPQDRLRVLSSAADVVAPVSKPVATRLAQQGAHLEAELISSGIKPAVSILAGGQVDCATAANFVEALPASAVAKAEDSLLGAISTCPKQASEPARIKLESALQSGTLAARPLMALMEQVAEGSVERPSLALTGVGEPAAEEPHPVALVALDDAGGVVARRVVDDQDGRIVGRQREQTVEAADGTVIRKPYGPVSINKALALLRKLLRVDRTDEAGRIELARLEARLEAMRKP